MDFIIIKLLCSLVIVGKMCKTVSCWKKIKVIDSQIAYVIHSMSAILSTSSIPVIHVQIPKYFHMASFLGPSLRTPTKKWSQEHITSHPNWLQFNQTYTKPKCYMVRHVPSKRVTHYKNPIKVHNPFTLLEKLVLHLIQNT